MQISGLEDARDAIIAVDAIFYGIGCWWCLVEIVGFSLSREISSSL